MVPNFDILLAQQPLDNSAHKLFIIDQWLVANLGHTHLLERPHDRGGREAHPGEPEDQVFAVPGQNVRVRLLVLEVVLAEVELDPRRAGVLDGPFLGLARPLKGLADHLARDFGVLRVVGLGRLEETSDGDQGDLEGLYGGPGLFQSVEADGALERPSSAWPLTSTSRETYRHRAHVGMPDLGQVLHGWRLEGVVIRDLDLDLPCSTGVGRVGRAGDVAVQICEVAGVGSFDGDARVLVGFDLGELFEDTSVARRHGDGSWISTEGSKCWGG